MSDYFLLKSASGDRTVTLGKPFKLSVNYQHIENFLANMS